jgi:two-component system response regulator PilR (NtrC family)
VETAIAAINAGADRYVIKDHDLVDQLRRAVRQVDETLRLKTEAGYLRRELRRLTGQDNIIGHTARMRAIFDMIMTVAPQTSRVLITGETGTGKELVARAIHENSARSKEPFITINCGAFPESLLESELFGYVKGAFTGANENRTGLFRGANGGTLFLDEIGNMGLPMQVKLFRVLQEGKVRPVGSNEEYEIDVRVIAATNKDLDKAIAAGEFREDLYYRLSVIPIQMPPLRERREDIPLMARSFLERFRKTMEKPIEGITPEAMLLLEAYDWPGNVRELENTMERSVALETKNMISVEVLPEKIQHRVTHETYAHASPANGHVHIPDSGIDLEKSVQDMERAYILAALEASNGVGTRAAELLKMTYRSFRHYSKKYNTRQA